MEVESASGYGKRRDTEFFVLCVAVAAWQCFYVALDTHLGGLGNVFHEWHALAVAIANALVLLSPYWLLSPRWRGLIWIPMFLLPVWCLIQVTYCRAYEDLMPMRSLAMVGNVNNVLKDSLIAVITILITVLIYMLSRRHQMEMENERLQSENLLVRYETLENQLDPHFLFNSLNTLSGLIGTDDEKAQAYLMQLASTYRYTIQQNKLVPLADELAFADAYLYMMNIRYGDSLTVVRHFDEVQSGYYVVPISVQLLIETAIKHNVVSNRHPLTITVASTGHGSLRVSNSMCPKEEDSTSEGIGLSNMDKRYELITGEHISVSNDGTTFSVEIPLIPAQKAEAILAKLGEEMG